MKGNSLSEELPKGWHLARFDEFLQRIDRKITIDDSASYNCVGVRWYGNGAFIREQLLGMNIARKQQWIIKAGDIVYNKLFAWKGAFAIADKSVNGCIVSDKFPTYEINTEIIEPRFLRHYFRTPQLAQRAQNLSKGAAAISKLTLNPPQFWDLAIPLPHLDEQRLIVAKIDELATKIEEAQGLRRQGVVEADALVKAAYEETFAKLKSSRQQLPLNKITKEIGQQVKASQMDYLHYPYLSLENIEAHTGRILNYKTYQEAGIRGSAVKFGTDDVLYSKLRPYLNKVITPSFEGCATTELVVLRPDPTIVDRNYLAAFLRNPQIVQETVANSAGTKMPRTNMKLFRQILVPLPSIVEQRHIVAYLDELQVKVNTLKRVKAETASELDELLPSILDKAFKGEL